MARRLPLALFAVLVLTLAAAAVWVARAPESRPDPGASAERAYPVASAPVGGAPAPVLAEARRQALVIGNALYQGQRPLANTLNDARDMARTLGGLGFDLAGGGPLENADRMTMAVAINRFLAGVQTHPGVALIYYAGHGMRDAAGSSYLIPTDARIKQEPDIAAAGIGLSGVLDQLDHRPRGAVSLVILDACRDNPFDYGGRGERSGLGAVTDPPRGTLLLYAASPGQRADDNPGGRNGLFTGRLLERLATPGLGRAGRLRQRLARGRGAERRPSGPLERRQPARAHLPGRGTRRRPRPGTLQVSVDAPGARVRVDGREVGTAAPGAPLNLSNLGLGTVQLEVTAPGRQPVTRGSIPAAGRGCACRRRRSGNMPAAGAAGRRPTAAAMIRTGLPGMGRTVETRRIPSAARRRMP